MQINVNFDGDIFTTEFGPSAWNYLYVYHAASDNARLVFNGTRNFQIGTGMALNDTYIRGRFSMYIDPATCENTTVTFTGTYSTLIRYVPTGSGDPITIRIDYNYFDIPLTYQNQPIAIGNLANYMGPSSGKVEFAPCYLPGTMIETPDGETPVEALRAGDTIIVYNGGERAVRTIRAVGCGQANIRPSAFDDVAGWPVRVLGGALADNVPYKDLLITSEHCLYLQGSFVPVRMLVNGQTIFYDKTISAFNYYHIEMDPHAIIRADGVLSESYIGQGHGHALHSPAGPDIPMLASDWAHAAAPLNTGREFVEALYRQIAARAAGMKGGSMPTPDAVCNDHNLHLLTEAGTCITGQPGADGTIRFMVPHAVQSIYLMSRASRACDAQGPFVDDRRVLGVLVGRITIEEGGVCSDISTHVEQAELTGWQSEIAGDMRWTTGNGLLPLPARHYEGMARLSVEIRAAGPYLAPTPLCMPVRKSA